jgi:hypothetical protein
MGTRRRSLAFLVTVIVFALLVTLGTPSAIRSASVAQGYGIEDLGTLGLGGPGGESAVCAFGINNLGLS